MSWLSSKKSKKTKAAEEQYKIKLDQLDKLGWGDRKGNLALLKLYGGNVNMVIKEFQKPYFETKQENDDEEKNDTTKNNEDTSESGSDMYEPVGDGMTVMDTPGNMIDENTAASNSQNNHNNNLFQEMKDRSCEEFERFLSSSIPNKHNAQKYLKSFKQNGYDNIQYIDLFYDDDENILQEEVQMTKLDIKIFRKKIARYKQEKEIFRQCFQELNKNDIYYTMFEAKGISTLMTFNLYIESVNDVNAIVKSKNHSLILWNHIQSKINYKANKGGSHTTNQIEGQ